MKILRSINKIKKIKFFDKDKRLNKIKNLMSKNGLKKKKIKIKMRKKNKLLP